MRDLSKHPELLSINHATVRMQCTLPQLVDLCARKGVRAIATWRDKIADHGIEASARLIRDAGLRVTGHCRAGLFAANTAEERKAILAENCRALDEAAAVGAESLCVIGGGLPKGSRDIAGAHEQVRDGLAAMLEHARRVGVKIGLEPLHPMYAADRACVNTMKHANDLCDALGPGIGILVDVYHVWWDPELPAEIARAGRAGRILGFHVCDWLVPMRDMLLDRGMMGDGVIDIPRIRGLVEGAGYRGSVEVEIFSAENWWKRDAGEVFDVCKQRYATVC
ncbi:MAG: sugar phosphate isomerase/epimerase [Alphaproteobacteria bacterium]|nr:sugar phosphate isomerase/epimerase [Alphaproteobacteria bacterium]